MTNLARAIMGALLLLSIPTAWGQAGKGFTVAQWLERHDGNQDGAVSKAEFKGRPQMFSRLDTDKNDSVTRAEIAAGLKAWQGARSDARGSRGTPEGVTTHRDLEFAQADGTSLKLDLYLPKQAKSPPPLVVWIHGGGWKNGDKANVNGAVLQLARDGYAVASINYRLKDLSIHPKHIHDCKGAVRWLRAHAGTYGYDATRVAVGGGSAGGHLALLLGMSSGVEDLEGTVGGHPDQAAPVLAIVDFFGPSEFSAFAKRDDRFNRARLYKAEQLVHASPLTYLTPDDPPVLIFHGDQDNVVPVEQSRLLHERYQEAGLISELYVLPGAGHGGSEFSDGERHRLIKAFLDQHLQPPPAP